MVKIKVVDTNVLVVANGNSQQADIQCQLSCIGELLAVKEAGSLALDSGGEILEEYARHCSWAGGPGVGDEFFRWATDTAYSNCLRIPITEHQERGYSEFPEDPALATFDNDDRKFVAVACACPREAEVLNAVDSDYEIHTTALTAGGVSVRELCPQCLAPREP